MRKARAAEVRLGVACLHDLETRAGRSVVARAIVLKLAGELAAKERVHHALIERQRAQLAAAPPEWN